MSGAVVVVVLAVVVVLGYVVYRFLISNLKSTNLNTGIVHCRSDAKTKTKTLPGWYRTVPVMAELNGLAGNKVSKSLDGPTT
eukprot:jgi/Tetstr1/428349/TSEL_018384.t1